MGGYFSKTVYVESRNFSGIGERIEWCLRYHFRGFIGTLICIIYGSACGRFMNNPKNAIVIANVMIISYLLQPVCLPVTGMFPIFLLPMTGILKTAQVCSCYFSSNSSLIFMGGLMSFLLNNTGLDRRLITQILTFKHSYKPNILLFKTCFAAYLTSFWGNHLYASATMYECLEPIFASLQLPPPPPPPQKDAPKEKNFNYKKYQHCLNQALLISANLGHLNMIHTSWILMLLRHDYYGSHARGSHQDLFNYVQYMIFSLIFTSTALCITILYFIIVIKMGSSSPMSDANMNIMTTKFKEARKNELVPMRTYQKVRNTIAIIFLLLAFVGMLTRYSPWLSWSIAFRTKNLVSDATVTAVFIILLCAFPRHFGFIKIFSANKRSDINLKPESGLLFWRFVDKAVNYGYIFVFGGSLSIIKAFRISGVTNDASKLLSPTFDSLGLFFSLGILSLGTIFICNIASPVPAAAGIFPFVLATVGAEDDLSSVVKDKAHIFALVCASSASLAYLFPFKNTIMFHRNHLTRTKTRHVWHHAIILSLLHGLLLVVLATFLGNIIWFQKIEEYESPTD